MYNPQEIAERIKMTAKIKGIPLKELLKECNLGVNYISEVSKGKDMTVSKLVAIANCLKCSVGYLLGSDENKNASAESKLSEGNVVRLAGRDGSYFEKVLPDDLYEILKKFIDSLDGDHDPRL